MFRSIIAALMLVAAVPAWAGYVGEGPDGPKSAEAKTLDSKLRAGKISCVQWVHGLEKLPDEEWERVGPGPKNPDDDAGWTFDNKWSPLAKRCKTEFMHKYGSLQPPED